jgi:hypothetical protein
MQNFVRLSKTGPTIASIMPSHRRSTTRIGQHWGYVLQVIESYILGDACVCEHGPSLSAHDPRPTTTQVDMNPQPNVSSHSAFVHNLFRPDCYHHRNVSVDGNDRIYWRRIGVSKNV